MVVFQEIHHRFQIRRDNEKEWSKIEDMSILLKNEKSKMVDGRLGCLNLVLIL
jgi:hypothetical protein